VKISTLEFDFLTPLSLQGTIFWRFEDVFRWFLHSICWMSTILLLPVYLTHWARKCVACFSPHGDNFHQVWNWYDHQLPSYSVLAADTLYMSLWLWRLTFWPWSVVIHGGSYDQRLHYKFEAPTAIRLSVLELWALTLVYRTWPWPRRLKVTLGTPSDLSPIDRPYTSFYRHSVVTLALDRFVSEISLVLYRKCHFCTYPSSFAHNLEMFP